MDFMIKYDFTVILSKEKKVLTFFERFSNAIKKIVITVFVRQREPQNKKSNVRTKSELLFESATLHKKWHFTIFPPLFV